MAGPDLSKFLPPDATPEEKNRWLRQFYPTAADTGPAVDTSKDLGGGMSIGPITSAPARKQVSFQRLDPAVEAGHIQHPGQTPKGGDTPEAWKAFYADEEKRKAEALKANVDNAQFATDPKAATGPAQGGGVTVIPGERTQAQWQIQEGIPVAPENLQEYNQADEEKKQAMRTQYENGVARGQEQAGYLDSLAKDQKAREQEVKGKAAMDQARMNGEQMKLTNIIDKAQKGEEDSGAFLLPGALGSFISGIGVAIGAAAQAWTGSKDNPGLVAANAMIEKQMAKQHEATAKAKNAVDQQKTLIGSLRQQFGDDAMAEQAGYLTYLERMKTEAQKIDAASLPRDAKARYQDFISGLDAQIAERHTAFDRAAADKVQRTDIMTQTRVIGGGGPPAKQGDVHTYSEDMQKAGIPAAVASLQQADELIDQFGDGPIAGVGPSADARETLGKIAGYTPVGAVASIVSDQDPGSLLLSKREQKTRQIRASIENKAIQAISGAGVPVSEVPRLMAGIRGANTAEGMRTALDALRTDLTEKQKNIQAGVPKEAVQEYQRRGGTIVDVRRDKSQAPYVKEPK